MKKLFFLLISFFIFVVFSVFCWKDVHAGSSPYIVDQKYAPKACLDNISCATQVISNNGLGQTFIPTQNRLYLIQLYLREMRNGGSIRLQLIKNSDSSVVAETVSTMRDGYGWLTFDLTINTVVEPGSQYTIKLLTPEADTEWVWFFYPDYANGSRLGSTDGDFLFMTFGNTVTVDTTVPTTSPSTIETTTAIEDGEDGETIDGNETGTETPDAAESEGEIESPELTYVINGDDLYNGPIVETIGVEEDDILRIAGTGVPESRVVIYIGEYIFSTEVNEAGEWEIILYMINIAEGNYDVLGETQIDDMNKSDKVTLFSLLKNGTGVEVAKEVTAEGDEFDWTIATIAGLCLLLVLIISGYLLWEKQKAKKNKLNNGEKKNGEPVKETFSP